MDDEDLLSSHQHESKESLSTVYRSLLGAVLWLCLTNLNLIAYVIHLQCGVTSPLVKHSRSANKLVKRAVDYRENCGLHFPRLRSGCSRGPSQVPVRLVNVHDFSLPSKERKYGSESIAVLLSEDTFAADSEWYGDDVSLSQRECFKYF